MHMHITVSDKDIARKNLKCGTLAMQNSANVDIHGESATFITLEVDDNLYIPINEFDGGLNCFFSMNTSDLNLKVTDLNSDLIASDISHGLVKVLDLENQIHIQGLRDLLSIDSCYTNFSDHCIPPIVIECIFKQLTIILLNACVKCLTRKVESVEKY